MGAVAQRRALPAENLLGREDAADSGEGFRNLARGLSMARVHTAARSIGLARGALEDAAAYAQQRRQFDQPIGDFQAIRFKIAHMASEIEACRALMYQVAPDADAGLSVDHQASMVKYLASEMAERVTSEASRSTAAPATPPICRSSATGATPASRRSSKARRRSSCASSPTATCPGPARR